MKAQRSERAADLRLAPGSSMNNGQSGRVTGLRLAQYDLRCTGLVARLDRLTQHLRDDVNHFYVIISRPTTSAKAFRQEKESLIRMLADFTHGEPYMMNRNGTCAMHQTSGSTATCLCIEIYIDTVWYPLTDQVVA